MISSAFQYENISSVCIEIWTCDEMGLPWSPSKAHAHVDDQVRRPCAEKLGEYASCDTFEEISVGLDS